MRLRHREGTLFSVPTNAHLRSPHPPFEITGIYLPSGKNYTTLLQISSRKRFTNTFSTAADPRPAWNRPRGLARGKTPTTAGRCARRVHVVGGFNQDSGEYAEGDVRGRGQHVRVPNTKPMERGEAEPQSVGGVRRRASGGQKILA